METSISDDFMNFLKVTGFIIVFVLVLFFLASVAPTIGGAQKAVQSSGFTEVSVTGPSVLRSSIYCSDSDTFYFGIPSATNSNGQVVTNMYVCAGFLKGYTIRYH